MTGQIYSAEEIELSGIFSKLKKSVKKLGDKVVKVVAKAGPLVSLIPGGSFIGAAAGARVARLEEKKINAANAAYLAQEQRSQIQPAYRSRPVPYTKYGAPKPVTAPVTGDAESVKKYRERIKQLKAEKAAAASGSLVPTGNASGGSPVAAGGGVATTTYSPAQESASSFFEQNKTALMIGGGVAAAALLIALTSGSKK